MIVYVFIKDVSRPRARELIVLMRLNFSKDSEADFEGESTIKNRRSIFKKFLRRVSTVQEN